MKTTVSLTPIAAELPDLTALADVAVTEGFGMLHRLIENWRLGINRFDRPGEMLGGAFIGGAVVAVGGLNREPYEPCETTGRLRHVFVLPQYRRNGIATRLVEALLSHAAAHFSEVRLRTTTAEAAAFYEALGFTPIKQPTATHAMQLARRP